MGAADFQQAVDVNLLTYPFTVQNETCYYGITNVECMYLSNTSIFIGRI